MSKDFTWLYVASNPAFPNYVKIGWTRNNPLQRLNELDSTGVPAPFNLEHLICTEDASSLEKQVHDALELYRVRKNREFFEVRSSIVVGVIKNLILNNSINVYFEKSFFSPDLSCLVYPPQEEGFGPDDESWWEYVYELSFAKAADQADIVLLLEVLCNYCEKFKTSPYVQEVINNQYFFDRLSERYHNDELGHWVLPSREQIIPFFDRLIKVCETMNYSSSRVAYLRDIYWWFRVLFLDCDIDVARYMIDSQDRVMVIIGGMFLAISSEDTAGEKEASLILKKNLFDPFLTPRNNVESYFLSEALACFFYLQVTHNEHAFDGAIIAVMEGLASFHKFSVPRRLKAMIYDYFNGKEVSLDAISETYRIKFCDIQY